MSLKKVSLFTNIVLIAALLALVILHFGQPSPRDEDEVTAAQKAAEIEHGHDHAEHDGHVAMTDRQLSLSGIEILEAKPAIIKTSLNLIGQIKLNADRSVNVTSRLPGIVESVAINAGDHVRKGQVLAVLSSQALADQRGELLAAQKRLALAKATYEREQRLWEAHVSAERDYLIARQALGEAEIVLAQAEQKLRAINTGLQGRDLTRYEIRAPIAGVVTEKSITTGQVLNGTEMIYMISDLSSVWAELTVYAKDINSIKAGQQVTIKSATFDGHAPGVVSYIGSLVGADTRATIARVVLPNPEGLWVPGLPINVELSMKEVEVPLAVSVEALQSMAGETVVFARHEDSFDVRRVSLGRRDGRYAEVLDGLRQGERYAAGNSYLVKAEIGKAGAEHDH